MSKGSMVVVKAAGYRDGFSGRDHLLRHGEIASAVVGVVFTSEAAAKLAAEAAAEAAGETVPVWVTVVYMDNVPEADIRDAVGRASERYLIEEPRWSGIKVVGQKGGIAKVTGLGGGASEVRSVRLYVA